MNLFLNIQKALRYIIYVWTTNHIQLLKRESLINDEIESDLKKSILSLKNEKTLKKNKNHN